MGAAPDTLTGKPPVPDLTRLPPVRQETVALGELRHRVRAGDLKIAVIDDDPTGTQTVRDVPIVASWDEAELEWAVETADPMFAVLTNSRALPESKACAINDAIGERLGRIAARSRVQIRAVSRGDSTLRGHFPSEPEALAAGLRRGGQPIDAILVCPAFPQAGRLTVENIHLVRSGDSLCPVAETEYARDPVFGYGTSNLVEWVRGQAGGQRVVPTISIDDLRVGGPDRVAQLLQDARGAARYVVANAADEADLGVLALGVDRAERRGIRLLCRTGPSFLAARMGCATPAPLSPGEEGLTRGRGLVVVGSHTALTTAQFAIARERHDLAMVTLDVEDVLRGRKSAVAAINRATTSLRTVLRKADAALVTTRTSAHRNGSEGLRISRLIADAIVETVGAAVADTPVGWVLAKGGITSHDVALRALRARRARVLGQLFPGRVSVWELGVGSLRPGLRYVVFPGNVGDETTLADALDLLKARS